MKKGTTRATILVANDPQTHVTSIKRENAKTCTKSCERNQFCRRRHVCCDDGSDVYGSSEAGLDRTL